MTEDEAPLPTRASGRTLALGGAALIGLACVAGLLWLIRQAGAPVPDPTTLGAGSARFAPRETAATADDEPRFDLVRVAPGGNAVIAGRAAPRAEVVITENGKELGRAPTDGQGAWVLVPERPLAPGARTLTLAARAGDGRERAGDTPVVIVVPDLSARPAPPATPGPAPPVGNAGPAPTLGIAGAATTLVTPSPGPPIRPSGSATSVAAASGPTQAARAPDPPLAVALPPDGPARVISPPLQPAPGATPGQPGKLGLDIVDYDDEGAVRFSGTGAPGSAVAAYVDNRKVAEATVGPQGRWTMVPQTPVGEGEHRIRVDQMALHGVVGARVELPFQRAIVSPADAEAGRVIVQPRQNLWRIARRAYGRGMRYTVIYEANRDQIRDPRLIYPGQIFSIPVDKPEPASSKPR